MFVTMFFWGLLMISAAPNLWAQDNSAPASSTQAFAITPQPLSSALLQFSSMTKIELLYDASMTRDIATQGVSGEYAPEEALRILLRDTGLSPRTTTSGSITLERMSGPQSLSSTGSPSLAAAPEASPRPAAQKSVKVPEIVVKDIHERDDDAPDLCCRGIHDGHQDRHPDSRCPAIHSGDHTQGDRRATHVPIAGLVAERVGHQCDGVCGRHSTSH
jgi:hypothetical protein